MFVGGIVFSLIFIGPLNAPVKSATEQIKSLLAKEDLVRPVADMIVWKALEKSCRFYPVIVNSPCRLRLARPEDCAIFAVALAERVPVPRVPRIVERLHKLHVLLFSCLSLAVNCLSLDIKGRGVSSCLVGTARLADLVWNYYHPY